MKLPSPTSEFRVLLWLQFNRGTIPHTRALHSPLYKYYAVYRPMLACILCIKTVCDFIAGLLYSSTLLMLQLLCFNKRT